MYRRRTGAFERLIGRGDCESGVNRKDNGDDGDGDGDDGDGDEIGSDEYSISIFVTLISRI